MKKKNNNKALYGRANYNNELMQGVKILVSVVILIAIIYFATAILTGEINFNKTSNDNVSKDVMIQYDEIVAGQSFTRYNSSYYVLYYNFTDNSASKYLSLRNAYIAKDKALSVYMVDLEKAFNSTILKEKDAKIIDKPTNIKDLKVENPTLLKFEKGKVVQRISGKENIEKHFESITK
ncbi:MAG: hypothetical protein HFG48_01810 [Bacilli bacterium]|nr:hypothetical protein [Bacilli bacterium]